MIELFHFTHNYGDDLGPYIVSRLSGDQVVLCRPFSPNRLVWDGLMFVRDVLQGRGFRSFPMRYSARRPLLMSIGSTLSLAEANCVVWGSGITRRHGPINRSARIVAVRGPLTIHRLREAGHPPARDDLPTGDPALLLPLVYPQRIQPLHPLGVVAHHKDAAWIGKALARSPIRHEIKLISLLTARRSVSEITDDILSCRRIISSALHGLIAAHAYGVPAIRIASTRVPGDGSKFADYFGSVGIDLYDPPHLHDLLRGPLDAVSEAFSTRHRIALPQSDLSGIQARLLACAPFPLAGSPALDQSPSDTAPTRQRKHKPVSSSSISRETMPPRDLDATQE